MRKELIAGIELKSVIVISLWMLILWPFLYLGLPVLVEDKPHPLDENIRRVERGSRIVVAVTQDTKVVLQVILIYRSLSKPTENVVVVFQRQSESFKHFRMISFSVVTSATRI